MEWVYLKGSEKDFEGAPGWSTVKALAGELYWFLESKNIGFRGRLANGSRDFITETFPNDNVIIAERTPRIGYDLDLEFCKDNPGDPRCVECGAQKQSTTSEINYQTSNEVDRKAILKGGYPDPKKHYNRCHQVDLVEDLSAAKENFAAGIANKYQRQCKGVMIDVYDVLQAWNVTNPALQHLIKKALCPGERGHKDRQEDLQDILDSAKRAIELEKE